MNSIMFGGIPNMEIESLRKYWDAFPGLREEIFGNISDNYARVIADDIESAVSNFASVSNYIAKYHSSFSGFGEYLKDCLIEDILDVNAQSLKENICIDIFNRTTNIKLIDQYKAFQILSENWETITADLEMIQGEGFDAIFQVDPNMVVKKKKEDEDEVTEVQEGWKGHILPFELVQEEFHHGELFAIQSGEERLVEISNMYTEILESLEEDELEQTITNDDKNAFVGKEVKAYVTEALTDVESPEINALKNYLTLSFKKDKMAFIEENPFVAWSAMVSNKDGTYGKPAVNSRILQLQMEFEFPEESLEAKMKRVMLLMEEESELKKVIKAQKIELEAATIETIKNLDEEDALRLLELKWIEPIVSGLGTLPDDVITALVSEVENLNSKYATTYSDIEVKKESAAGSLIQMIDGLSGTIDNEGGGSLEKEDGIVEILEAYNKHFNQKYTIPTYDKFRKEVSLRLGHKKPFDSIGKDEQIDILIVVNQMLTGFDSKFVNTLYLDKMMEYENLIQAFSRTNRLYNMAEKPFGIIKYYRRPNTMEKNIEAAVKAYSGDVPTGLFVDKLPNNLRNMNVLFQSIEQIFKNAGIVNFEKLPADNAAIGKFAKEFNKFVNHLEAAIIQGFTWSKNSYPDEDQNEDAIKMLIDEQTYLTLLARYI